MIRPIVVILLLCKFCLAFLIKGRGVKSDFCGRSGVRIITQN
jgi:hypothetical protein